MDNYEKSPITGKVTIPVEDFIIKYKDTDDQFIQGVINGLVEDYVKEIIFTMTDLAYKLELFLNNSNTFSLRQYHTISHDMYKYYGILALYYYEANTDESVKIWWDCLGHDMEYYWEKEILSEKNFSNFPKLSEVLKEGYINSVVLEAKKHVQ